MTKVIFSMLMSAVICLVIFLAVPYFLKLLEIIEYNNGKCVCGGEWKIVNHGDSRNRYILLHCDKCEKEITLSADFELKK